MAQWIFFAASAVLILSLSLAWVTSLRPARPDASGWVPIRPGPPIYAIAIAGTAFGLGLIYISIFVELRPGDPHDWFHGPVTGMCFLILSARMMILSHWDKVRWKSGRIQVRSVLGQLQEYRYDELQRVVFRRYWGAFDLYFSGRRRLQIYVLTKGSMELFRDLGYPDLEWA